MILSRCVEKFEMFGFFSNDALHFSAGADIFEFSYREGLSLDRFWYAEGFSSIPFFKNGEFFNVCFSGCFSWQSIQEGAVEVMDSLGHRVKVNDVEIFLAVFGRNIPGSDFVVLDIADYLVSNSKTLFLLKDKSIYAKSDHILDKDLVSYSVVDDSIFSVNFDKNIVERFGFDFNFSLKISSTVYSREFLISSGSSRSNCLIDSGDNVVLSIGHRSNQCDEDVRAYREGVVVAFDKATLAISWRQELEFSIDDIVSCKERLFIASGSSLYLMDQSTGSVIDVLKMPFDRKTWRLGAAQCEMFVAENLLYIPAADDNKIFLLDIEKFELVGTITLPSGWTCNKVLAKNPNGSEIFWEAELIDSSPDFHRFGLAVIDGDCLEGEVALEEPPGFDVLLKSSEKNAEEEEIWIQFEPCTLNQALRFGELCAQNLAYEHGESFTFRSPPNEKFNGKVHLRFAHIDGVKSEIDEKLIIMEKRFKKWAEQEEEIYCGMPKEIFCSLDARHGI